MEVWAIITGAAVVVGIVAGIVQVVQYMEGRRKEQRQPATEEATALPPPKTVIPNNIPARGEFIGREQEKARVLEALASRWPLTCIDGIGGIGKTALALEVAGECLRASRGEVPADDIPTFNGFIWTTAKDRELALNDLLDAVARTLDYPGITQEPMEEKQESVRRLLQSKQYLLIVDNFETVTDEAVRDFLLRLPEPSKALITSREQKLRQAWAVSLKGLEQAEALALIRSEGRRLGLPSLEGAEEQVLLRLYQATGGAPLAIKWAVGQIKQKGQSLDTVLAALHQAKGDIFEDIFARSWSLLSEDAQHILMVMPIFATSAARGAIEAASDVYHFALDDGLGQLVEMWLVEATDELEAEKRCYSIHPLTRAFAGTKLSEDENWEKGARLRAAEHFLDLAQQHDGWGNREGFSWFELELANILAILGWWYEVGAWRQVIRLMNTLLYFMGTRGYWRERIKYQTIAINAAEELGDDESLAWMKDTLAWVYFKQRDYAEAEDYLTEAETLYRELENWRGLCSPIRHLGKIALQRGNVEEAQGFAEEALEIAQKSGDDKQINSVYGDFGDIELQRGNYSEAETLYREALQWFEKADHKADHTETVAGLRIRLGKTALLQERLNEAREHYRIGLELNQEALKEDGIARAQHGLARIEERAGNSSSALEFARSAQKIFDRLGMQREAEETRTLVEQLEGKPLAD